MNVPRQINTYCPKCNKYTAHKVILYSKGRERGMSVGTRRNIRKRKGYVGKVKGQATIVKSAKRQKVLLGCAVCKYTIERILGSRTKKKLEFTI